MKVKIMSLSVNLHKEILINLFLHIRSPVVSCGHGFCHSLHSEGHLLLRRLSGNCRDDLLWTWTTSTGNQDQLGSPV